MILNRNIFKRILAKCNYTWMQMLFHEELSCACGWSQTKIVVEGVLINILTDQKFDIFFHFIRTTPKVATLSNYICNGIYFFEIW